MDFINISLIVAVGVTLLLGTSIYLHHRKGDKFTIIFSLLALSIGLWSVAMIIFRYIAHEGFTFIFAQFLYAIPVFIPIFFYYFTTFFTKKFSHKLVAFLHIAIPLGIAGGIFFSVFFTDSIVTGVVIPPEGEKQILFGQSYFLYILYYFFFFGLAFVNLFKRYSLAVDELLRKQLFMLVIGTSIPLTLGLMTNLILPWFGLYQFNWFANLSSIIFMGFILFAIVQYKLFNLSVVATELFVLFILSLLVADMLIFNSTTELSIKVLLFISVALLSVFLIRGAYKEMLQRERIEKLAQDLEKANVRLRELDKLKSEFVSIASHQLRSPLTAIKGYASMLLEDSYGKFPEKAKEAVTRIFDSSNLMTASIEDFLNVSRIEQGRMKYEKSDFDLASIAETVFHELEPIAKKKHLEFSFGTDNKGPYTIHADLGKIKQVLSNLIDNAIKYTPTGGVRMLVSRQGDVVQFKVKDTGIGASKETIAKLFDRFVRAKNANKVNVTGSGLGLYVAKQMVEAHDGKIWIESEGEGKGSTFIVELKAV
ncbi:MAG: ATP-binding protein [Candidatus Paceibacterota bacterium]